MLRVPTPILPRSPVPQASGPALLRDCEGASSQIVELSAPGSAQGFGGVLTAGLILGFGDWGQSLRPHPKPQSPEENTEARDSTQALKSRTYLRLQTLACNNKHAR